MAYHWDRNHGRVHHTDGSMAYSATVHAVNGDIVHSDVTVPNDNTIHKDDQFDILRFMSVIANSKSLIARSKAEDTEKWSTLVLLSVHLGPWNLYLPFTPYRGASFSVMLIPRQYLLRQTPVGMDLKHSLAKIIALKTPRLGQEDKRNARLLRSTTKEYQILQSESLKHHDNIVSVYGCCWQSLEIYDGLPIPCLLLEGTELGDLYNFSQTRELTLRERLRICIQITSGLQAIHSIGIIHGDLKPQNILVFHSKERGYIAKIADFGEAIILGVAALPTKRPLGTILYNAPECYRDDVRLGREELVKTDIFALGIVLSAVIQGIFILEDMKKLPYSQLESLKKEGKFHHWLLALSLQDAGNLTAQGDNDNADNANEWETDPTVDEQSVLADEQLWAMFVGLLQGTLAAQATQRFASEETILLILRDLLYLHLRRILGDREIAPGAIPKRATPQWWSRMSSILKLSKARLRKALGIAIHSPVKLDPLEIEAILLCFLLGKSSKNLFKDLRFIQQHITCKQPRRCPASKWRSHTSGLLARKRQFRASFPLWGDTRLIFKMKELAKTWFLPVIPVI